MKLNVSNSLVSNKRKNSLYTAETANKTTINKLAINDNKKLKRDVFGSKTLRNKIL